MTSIAVDFDGVIHRYSQGWYDGSIYDPPMPGAIDGLARLRERYAVFVHTTRDSAQVFEWLRGHDVPVQIGFSGTFWDRRDVVLITDRKLPAIAYIDDRSYPFRSWSDVLTRFVGSSKTVTQVIAETLRTLAQWDDESRSPRDLLSVADTVERDDAYLSCPVCQEYTCDEGCPLNACRGVQKGRT